MRIFPLLFLALLAACGPEPVPPADTTATQQAPLALS